MVHLITLILVAAFLIANAKAQFFPGVGGYGGFPGVGGIPYGVHPGLYHPHAYDPFYDPMLGYHARRPVRVEHHYYPNGKPEEKRRSPVLSLDNNVTRLSPTKFPDEESRHLWLVMFHDSSKMSQKAVSPVQKLAAKVKHKTQFKVGSFDCTATRKHKEICRKRVGSIGDLPRFGFVVDGKIDILQHKDDAAPPSAKKLYAFAKKNMPKSLIHSLEKESDLHTRILNKVKPQQHGSVILLTDKYETSALYYGLAYEYRKHFRFGESREANEEIGKLFGVKDNETAKGYPYLVAAVRDKETPGTWSFKWYEGSLDGDVISAWLDDLWRPENRQRPSRANHGKDTTATHQTSQADQHNEQEATRPARRRASNADQHEQQGTNRRASKADQQKEREPIREASHVEPSKEDATDDEFLDLDFEEDAKDEAAGLFQPIEIRLTTPVVVGAATRHMAQWDIPTVIKLILSVGILFWISTKFGRTTKDSSRMETWVSVDDCGSASNKSVLSGLANGILYVHHHYLGIAWYIAVRTALVVGIVRGFLHFSFEHSPEFGTIVLSFSLRHLGDVGFWSQGLFLLMIVMGIDSATLLYGLLARTVKYVLVSQSLVGVTEIVGIYDRVFSQPLSGLAEANKVLEALINGSGRMAPQGGSSSVFFMFFDPFFGSPGFGGGFHPGFGGGFHPGLGGGFPGHHVVHGHPGGMYGHPMIHGHPMVHTHPGGFFHEIVSPTPTPSSTRTHADQEATEAINELLAYGLLIISVLLVAPVSEELVFRYGFDKIRVFFSRIYRWWQWVRTRNRFKASTAIMDQSRMTTSDSTFLLFGCHPCVLISSILFATSHLNNHIPRSIDVDALMKEGTEKAVFQLTLGIIQTSVAFFMSVRVFTLVYERMGLVASMGAHFMWNACAMWLVHQVWVRLAVAIWNLVTRRLRASTSSPATPVDVELLRHKRQEAFQVHKTDQIANDKVKAD